MGSGRVRLEFSSPGYSSPDHPGCYGHNDGHDYQSNEVVVTVSATHPAEHVEVRTDDSGAPIAVTLKTQ